MQPVPVLSFWCQISSSGHYRRSHSHLSTEGIMRVNPVFENDDGILSHVSSISYPTIADSGSSQPSDQVSFYSLENMRLSIEVKCTVQKGS